MPPKLDRLVDGLGTDWSIQPPSLKSYATHVTHQAVVQAIQDFQREHPLQPQHITRVVIRGARRIMEERHTVRAPESIMGGQYSLPFTAAVALTRDLSNPLTYNDEAMRDPVVRDLAQRIEQPHKGSPHNPFTWEEVCAKFRCFTASIISARQATAFIEAVGSLEQVTDMATVAQLVTRM